MEQVHGILVMALLRVLIFGVDGSSSTHANNRKNNFGESRTYGINGSFASPQKKVSINFSKAKKNLFEFTL